MRRNINLYSIGTIVPPIPEKRWTGNMDETFVEERRLSLEHFINEVCSHDKLVSTLELQILLTASNEGLIAARELLPIQSYFHLPSTSTVASIWGTMKDGLIYASRAVQQIDIKTDEGYLQVMVILYFIILASAICI